MSQTPVLAATPEAIRRAAAIIRAGGLVAFPTETVYGLGANGLDAEAVRRIFTAKGRPLTDPVIIHAASIGQLAEVGVLPNLYLRLAQAFMPGPLTLILPRGPNIPPIVSAGRDTVAVRVPAHPVAQALLAAAQVPIAAPSANAFSRPSATTAAHVLEDLDGRIDLVLDGLASTIGVESTIIDLTTTPPTLRRPGGVPIEALRAFIPDLAQAQQFLDSAASAVAPGQLLKHYSPRAQVRLYTTADGRITPQLAARMNADLAEATGRVGVLLTGFALALPPAAQAITLGDDPVAASAHLFASLRALDAAPVDVIFAAWVRRDGLAAAVWDRLVRAAEGHVIFVKP